MSAAELVSWGSVLTVVVVAFLLGFAPVCVVRIAACMYPKGHARRLELVGEMAHVTGLGKTPQMWRWLGEVLATALWEAPGLRVHARRQRRARRRNHGLPWADDELVEVRVVRANGTVEGRRLMVRQLFGPDVDETARRWFNGLAEGDQASILGPRGQTLQVMSREQIERRDAQRQTSPGRHRRSRGAG